MKKYIQSIILSIPDRYIVHYLNSHDSEHILIMEKNGIAFARICWYHNDTDNIYLSYLSVEEKFRKTGIGTELQDIRENIGIKIGSLFANLCVERYSWMYEWYKRRGYEDNIADKNDPDYIWMKKQLK